MKNVNTTQNGRWQSRRLLNTALKFALLGGAALFATGCSSIANVGASDFNCASTDGVKCKSTREVYEMTNNGNVPTAERGVQKKRYARLNEQTAQQEQDQKQEQEKEDRQALKDQADPVAKNYVAPRLPDRPVPIRTPAEVMRIWIAPWEDKNGDLNTNGYVYTEIEPRRWVIGKPNSVGTQVLRPLQTIQNQSQNQNQ